MAMFRAQRKPFSVKKITFPSNWIEIYLVKDLKYYFNKIPFEKLMKRVLDFLLLNFNCNTHSLRYAFINHMIYDLGKDSNIIAKFVGHVNSNQITRYTQQKNVEKMFNEDI